MKKKVFSGVFALVILLIAGYGVNRSMNSYADLSDLALKNVLALANIENPDPGEGGGLDCSYHRHPEECIIYVGAYGTLEIFGGRLIKAGANGYVSFGGMVSCSDGGDKTCTPVDCIDLYKIIFA